MPSKIQMHLKDKRMSVSMLKRSETIKSISEKWKSSEKDGEWTGRGEMRELSSNRPLNETKKLEHTVAHSLMNTNPNAHFLMDSSLMIVEPDKSANRILTELTQAERLRSAFTSGMKSSSRLIPTVSFKENTFPTSSSLPFGVVESFESLSWGEDEKEATATFATDTWGSLFDHSYHIGQQKTTIDKDGFPMIAREAK